MPLAAIVNDKKIIAPDLSDDEWEIVKRSNIRMDCCGNVGYGRKSVLGLKHFYHAKNVDCPYRDEAESEDHRQLKYEIYQSCEKLGWKADIEHNAGDWIADVFAEKDGKKVAFEIQLSPQTYNETVSRTKTYKEQGIRCYWLLGQLHNVIKGSNDIDMFEVRVDGNKSVCNVNGKVIPLSEFVERALSGQIRAPNISPKNTDNSGKERDSGFSGPGNGESIKSKLSLPFTAFEENLSKTIRVVDMPMVLPIKPSAVDRTVTLGILKYRPEEMKRVDDDHISYDYRTWDIIGSCPTLEEAWKMRHKVWEYYHCTLIIDYGSTFTVIAQELKDYVHQPGLHAIRSTI